MDSGLLSLKCTIECLGNVIFFFLKKTSRHSRTPLSLRGDWRACHNARHVIGGSVSVDAQIGPRQNRVAKEQLSVPAGEVEIN